MRQADEKAEWSPRLIAWEVTRRCNLKCEHCRAAAEDKVYPDELNTAECFKLLDNIAGLARPIMILTGGEPMLRDDIYRIARHGHELGLPMVMAPCGALVDGAAVSKMIEAGIRCISISLDGATAQSHDEFRGVAGSFDAAVAATEAARDRGLAFQINTTITRRNVNELGDIMGLAEKLGAVTFNPFLLVPTGRGAGLADEEINAEQYEQTLRWLGARDNMAVGDLDPRLRGDDSLDGGAASGGGDEQRGKRQMQIRVTCAPHYQRIIRQGRSSGHSGTGEKVDAAGCMGGKGFAFISHVGKVQICGFLEEAAGDLKANGFDFATIWRESELFKQVRDVDSYKGKCGYCEYRWVCGGCRARAFALGGDYLGPEPYCVFEPQGEEKWKNPKSETNTETQN